MHSSWPNACVSARSQVPEMGSGKGRCWDGTNHGKKWWATDPGFIWVAWAITHVPGGPGAWNPCPRAGAGKIMSATGNHYVSGNAASPLPAVSSPSASFCCLIKNCYVGALKYHWPQFHLLRWEWLSVAGYLLLVLSVSTWPFVTQAETENVALQLISWIAACCWTG